MNPGQDMRQAKCARRTSRSGDGRQIHQSRLRNGREHRQSHAHRDVRRGVLLLLLRRLQSHVSAGSRKVCGDSARFRGQGSSVTSSALLLAAGRYTTVVLLGLAWGCQSIVYSQPEDVLQMLCTGGAVVLGASALGLVASAAGWPHVAAGDAAARRHRHGARPDGRFPCDAAGVAGGPLRPGGPQSLVHDAAALGVAALDARWYVGRRLDRDTASARDSAHLPQAILRAPGPEHRVLGMDDGRDVGRGARVRIFSLAIGCAQSVLDARRHVQRYGCGHGGKRCALSLVFPPGSHDRFEPQSTQCRGAIKNLPGCGAL